jgi:hypothetical protein
MSEKCHRQTSASEVGCSKCTIVLKVAETIFCNLIASDRILRWFHPNSVWSHFRRRKQEAERAAPAVRHLVKGAMPSHKHGRPIFWPQDAVRRAHMAMLDSRSHDLLTLARLALEAAIRSENDLIELLSPDPATSALPRRTDVVSPGRLVRFVPNSEVTGYHFAFSTRYAARPFFPDYQREAQLLPDMTQRGCA